eukprot:gb/GECG01007246.1/.p1 GENE.gb/GECG01007246.1/~~gb/GECG01007246.1/.p1  ORF type:complete len:159 (+),score=5.82 gb/GECG01007246.1/:1-477(+)
MVWSCDTWALVGRSGADNKHNLPILRFQRIPFSSTSPSPTPAAIETVYSSATTSGAGVSYTSHSPTESGTLPPLFTRSGFQKAPLHQLRIDSRTPYIPVLPHRSPLHRHVPPVLFSQECWPLSVLLHRFQKIHRRQLRADNKTPLNSRNRLLSGSEFR